MAFLTQPLQAWDQKYEKKRKTHFPYGVRFSLERININIITLSKQNLSLSQISTQIWAGELLICSQILYYRAILN